MIKDKSKYTATIYFSENIPRISCHTYDYSSRNIQNPWYIKKRFQTLIIDIDQIEKSLLSSYQYRVRRYVKMAGKHHFEYNMHKSGEPFYHLQDSIVLDNEHLTYYPYSLLSPQPHRLFTTISHPDHGVLAMHGHLLDPDNKQCLLSMNISRYREFHNSQDRQLAGMANTYLFHKDFLYFRELGFKQYDMGGFEVETLKRFKKGFGGEVQEYYRYSPHVSVLIRKIKKILQ